MGKNDQIRSLADGFDIALDVLEKSVKRGMYDEFILQALSARKGYEDRKSVV